MGIEVQGKNCKLWISEHDGKNGKWYTYTVGVSKKDQDGQYVNAYQDVMFTRNAGLDESVHNGTTFDFEGWMSVRVSRDKEGKEVRRPIITINKAAFHVDNADSFRQLEEDMPF